MKSTHPIEASERFVPEDSRRRWLITGASGLLGWNAWLTLREHHEVIPSLRSSAQQSAFTNSVKLDLSSENEIRQTVEAEQPDVVLHTAALATHELCQQNPNLAFDINVRATQTLARACQALGAQFVYISTDSVFDGQRGNYSEMDPTSPFSVYGETKLYGEQAALSACENTLVVRTNFFGWSPGGRRSILEFFVSQLGQGLQTPGFTDFKVTSIYVEDLIEIIVHLVHTRFAGIIHVGARDTLSKYEFGRAVAKTFRFSEQLVHPQQAPTQHDSVSRSRDLSLNTKLLVSAHGSPPNQADGITRALNSPRRQIPLKGRTHDRI